jgi:hypothetical protein
MRPSNSLFLFLTGDLLVVLASAMVSVVAVLFRTRTLRECDCASSPPQRSSGSHDALLRRQLFSFMPHRLMLLCSARPGAMMQSIRLDHSRLSQTIATVSDRICLLTSMHLPKTGAFVSRWARYDEQISPSTTRARTKELTTTWWGDAC